ncbi:MAG: polysaccharide lyase family protein [Planctomycetota bacterium]|nr:polysaccharide lyase family protein [Planctomycetota bacterium]
MRALLTLLSMLLAAAAAAAEAQPPKPGKPGSDALFLIGRPDGSCMEFGLVQERWPGYAAAYRGPIVFTVGKSTAGNWPYIHPSTRDGWAGGKPHTFTIRFTAAPPVAPSLHLIIGALAIWEPSLMTIRVNGQEVSSRRLPAERGEPDLAGNPEREGKPIPLVFPIPDGLVKPGENSLGIELKDGSWIIYDYVRLGTSREPPPEVKPPAPELLKDFLAGTMAGVEDIVFAVRSVFSEHWYANIGYLSTDRNRAMYGKGGRLCTLHVKTGKLTTLLDDPEGSVRDPCVHYDGRRIVFSYRKHGTENYLLNEINADGTGLRQLTDGIYDDYEPCWLPDGGIAFVTTRAKRWVNCWLTQVGNIWRCDADGKNMRALSANLEHDNTPWILPDGRLLYMRWEYVDRSQVDYHHLWTMYPDGTGQTVFYGNLHPGGVFIDAKPIPNSDRIVLSNSPGHGDMEHQGFLAVLDVKRGPDEPSALRNISRQPGYRDPWAFSEDAFTAAQGNQLVLMNARGQISTLFTLPKEFGGVWLHEPRPLLPRPLGFAIPRRTDLARPTGQYLVDNVYRGRSMAGVKPGEIKKLLVIESLPKPINFTGGMDPLSYKGTFSLERVLGTVPVEADGSAYFEAPALRSLFFVALDGNGQAVKRMQSFTTVQPGETLGCLGCHEQRTTTRPSATNGTFVVPRASSPVAAVTGASSPVAAQRAPSPIEPCRDVADLPDFPRDIQPILDRHCLKCHDYDKRSGGVILTGDHGPMFSHSYYNLTVWHQISDGRNYARSEYEPRKLGSGGSPLIKRLDGEHHDVKVSPRERLQMQLWLDIGAPYPGTYAALGTGSIGGYIHNDQILNNDADWPETKAAQPVFGGRCATCHDANRHPLPRTLSDEIGLSFWAPDMNDPRLKYSRHVVFNLSRPEKSVILLAPLARSAGGYGLCRPVPQASSLPTVPQASSLPGAGKMPAVPADADSTVFVTKDDPGYRALLAMCEGGERRLEEFKRFDMPGFKPRAEYVREMKRYGLLPESFDVNKDPLNVYDMDRKYWDSLTYKPPALTSQE